MLTFFECRLKLSASKDVILQPRSRPSCNQNVSSAIKTSRMTRRERVTGRMIIYSSIVADVTIIWLMMYLLEGQRVKVYEAVEIGVGQELVVMAMVLMLNLTDSW